MNGQWEKGRHRAGGLRRLCLLLLLLPRLGTARAGFDATDQPPQRSMRRPRFMAEAASYLGPQGPVVQIGFEVPYRELFFQPSAHRYHAEFDLIMVLRKHGRQVGGDLWNEQRDVASFADTRSRKEFVRRVYSLTCPPGSYQVEVMVREARAGRENRLPWKLEVPDYGGLPLSLSSIWVSDCAAASPDSLRFPPPDWRIDRRFGEPLGPLCFLGEVYQKPARAEPVLLTWRILGARDEVVERGDLTLQAGARVPFRIRPHLSSLWIGNYALEVRASAGKEKARRRYSFTMEETAAAAEADVTQSLELISLIASRDELDELKASTPQERKEAWNRFWKRHDPTPDTEENEFKDEFFARVRYANEHYSVMEPGWKSDRGRTYIRYGPPDRVESYPLTMDSRPYEVWTYDTLGKRFVFVDYEGFGRYEFYQPGRS